MFEYIVVGSGCTAAMAAKTLVDSGANVAMLDVGNRGKDYTSIIPDKDFLSIRRSEPDQYLYLLGENLEGITWGNVGKGEQVTPPRKHMFELVDDYTPIKSESFSPAESLGYGGLGIGWGIGCWEFSAAELKQVGLDEKEMERSYSAVSELIGISATKDGAQQYTIRDLNNYQPSPSMDRNHKYLFEKYKARERKLNDKGFVMGRAPLALITEDTDDRKAYAYRDMDFYSDNDKSAYRPWITVDKLKKKANFHYIDNQLVLRFVEGKTSAEVYCYDTKSMKETRFNCKKLVLCAGVLGTARIVLRSLPGKDQKLPLLCNPYTYVPCIQPAMIGRAAEPRKLGFAQLSLFLDERGDNSAAAMASLYSYQSLMLFRMIRQVPLNFKDARTIMNYLMPGIIIMGIHQPDQPSVNKYLQLIQNAATITGDQLRAQYSLSAGEAQTRERREKMYLSAMRSMGAYAIKRIDPGFGSSIHYAGTLPVFQGERPYTLSTAGRLHGTRNIYVADGSGFNFLPAKGLTFTIMANAYRIAGKVLHNES